MGTLQLLQYKNKTLNRNLKRGGVDDRSEEYKITVK